MPDIWINAFNQPPPIWIFSIISGLSQYQPAFGLTQHQQSSKAKHIKQAQISVELIVMHI